METVQPQVEAAGRAIQELRREVKEASSGRPGSSSSSSDSRHLKELMQSCSLLQSWLNDLTPVVRDSAVHRLAVKRYSNEVKDLQSTLASQMGLLMRPSTSPIRTRPSASASAPAPAAPGTGPRRAGAPARSSAMRPPRISAPVGVSAELEELDAGDETPTALMAMQLRDDKGDVISLEVDGLSADLEERRLQDATALARELRDLHETNQDLARLVAESTERLDRAQDETDMAALRVEDGVYELAQAGRYQNKARTKAAGLGTAVAGGAVGLIAGGPKAAVLSAIGGGGVMGWITSKLSGRLNKKHAAVAEEIEARRAERKSSGGLWSRRRRSDVAADGFSVDAK